MEIERTSRLSSALSALQAAAREYKRRRRRPAALIIDNAEQLGQAQDVMRDLLFTGQRCCTLPVVFASQLFCWSCSFTCVLLCAPLQLLAHQPAFRFRLLHNSSA